MFLFIEVASSNAVVPISSLSGGRAGFKYFWVSPPVTGVILTLRVSNRVRSTHNKSTLSLTGKLRVGN